MPLVNLRNVLARLYSDETSARRIVADTGIDVSRIAFSTHSTNNWHAILTEAQKADQIDVLLDMALKEYGANRELRNAYKAYRSFVGQSRRLSPFEEENAKAQKGEEKHQHQSIKNKENPVVPSTINTARNVLQEAIKAVPAVRFAFGIAGIAAALAIIVSLFTDPLIALFGTIVMFLLMVVLVIFAALTKQSRESLRLPMLFLTWCSVVLTMATASFLFTSTFFKWPVNLQSLLVPSIANRQHSTLFVENAFAENIYFIKGENISKYKVEDSLVVYDEFSGTEAAIALLRVTSSNPDSLLAQAILVYPTRPILSGLRVDNNLDQLSTSELVPSFAYASGYLLREERIRLRPNSGVRRNTILQALEFEIVDGTIIDSLPFNPPITMRVAIIGQDGVAAEVELVEGDWPPLGTIVSIAPEASAPIPDEFSTHLARGYTFFENRELDKAEEQFDEARKLKPQSPDPWYWKAQVALAKDKRLIAIQFIEQALNLDSTDAHSLAFKIKLLLLTGGDNRKEAEVMANESRGISRELNMWLDCLNRNNIFSLDIVTATEIDAACFFIRSEPE